MDAPKSYLKLLHKEMQSSPVGPIQVKMLLGFAYNSLSYLLWEIKRFARFPSVNIANYSSKLQIIEK